MSEDNRWPDEIEMDKIRNDYEEQIAALQSERDALRQENNRLSADLRRISLACLGHEDSSVAVADWILGHIEKAQAYDGLVKRVAELEAVLAELHHMAGNAVDLAKEVSGLRRRLAELEAALEDATIERSEQEAKK